MSEKVRTKTATIANGASLSDGVLVDGACMVGIVTPSTLTGSVFTFQVSINGTTYNNLYNQTGAEVIVSCGTSRYIQLSPVDFEGFYYVKVRAGTSGTPSTQGAEALVLLCVEEL